MKQEFLEKKSLDFFKTKYFVSIFEFVSPLSYNLKSIFELLGRSSTVILASVRMLILPGILGYPTVTQPRL